MARSLSQAYMRAHPAQAARVLEALPAAEAARLFESTPARVGAEVMAAMLPQRAALCLAELDDPRALELLAPMSTQPTVAVLRQLPEARRRQLIDGLPTTAALASTLLLGYSEDTLGAWADPDVLALPPATRVADALERLRLSASAYTKVYVADAERRLVGVIDLAALLRAPDGTALATLARPAAALLAANAPLAGTHAHPGWLQSSALPVVERGDRLVGVMTHDGLARAVRRTAAPETGGAQPLRSVLAQGYWLALSGMVEASLGLLPRVPPLHGGGDGH